MSDHIPFDIQVKIMKNLPVKSLIQFRSVSREWKSKIDSPDFIADYTRHAQPQNHHLLIRYRNLLSELHYVSIADDDSFPQNKYFPTVSPHINLFKHSFVVGTSHGLICMYGHSDQFHGHSDEFHGFSDEFDYESETDMFVVWNPSIRKSVAIVVPGFDYPWTITIGFGVCPATSDPKIVKITDTREHSVTYSTPWLVEVFSLSSGVWRHLPNNNLSDDLVEFKSPPFQVTVDGFIYWVGIKNIATSDTEFSLLISFDLSSEEFREICLPENLAFHESEHLFLLKRSDSLALLKYIEGAYEVWVMENGASNSFTNLFTVNIPDVISLPLEFRRNGEVVMGNSVGDNNAENVSVALVVYEPFLEQIKDLGFKGQSMSLFMHSYAESLLLLDQ